MAQTPLFEQQYTAEFLVSESKGSLSRDKITIANGSGLVPAGMVLGRQAFGAGVATAAGGNHGNGVPSAVALGAGVLVGNYVLTATGPNTFSVVAPDGRRLADLATGVAYGDEIALTIPAGATPFQAGDAFTVAVAAGTSKYVPVNPAAVDGSQIAVAVNFGRVDATLADKPATIISRNAEVNAAELQWPAGTTQPQQAAALAQLAALNIIAR